MLKIGFLPIPQDFLDECIPGESVEVLGEVENNGSMDGANHEIKEKSVMKNEKKANMDALLSDLVRPELVTTIILQIYSNGSTKTTTIHEKEVPQPDSVINFHDTISVSTTASASWKKYNLITYSKVAKDAPKLTSALKQHETDRLKVIIDNKEFIGTIDADRTRIYSLKDAMNYIEENYGDIVKRDVILNYNIFKNTLEMKIK